ncbi:uncharacterized protein DSM5745_05580 [Aspergillus mulundensis]|uniref:Transcription factor domain-containing protein n=1 Tax=Aspergillus mulundensis TaxID=1810919 RepID=A0A3D8RXJ7_9EURO|nr:hypothetical protein DSM5745_05580 [Aspergillus mulundensis]RDW78728.1 hypothetical protein DSM5745_05580 [Aspergillus mulundensis]
MANTRIEKDSLGQLELPNGVLYGINTARSLENFPLSGRSITTWPDFIHAFATVKQAAARANCEVGSLTTEQADAIVAACEEIKTGEHDGHLVVDILEGSGGTSTNMNVNEVIANIATKASGRPLSDYSLIHPNDHVNLGQSTNDVLPTAMKLAVYRAMGEALRMLRQLADRLSMKREEYKSLLRLGRTCLQDAQPMTFGQAMGGYEAVIRRHTEQLNNLREQCLVVPLGGTAIGTGFGSQPGYKAAVFRHLSAIFGAKVEPSGDTFDGMQNMDTCARLSAELRNTASSLWKIANDLIILSSGPNGGIGEITLPSVQAGSSIMPGKVNPVIPMAVCQVAFAITGNDTAIAMGCQQGMLEINHFEMLVCDRLLDSIRLIAGATGIFTRRCVDGLVANKDVSQKHLLASSALATSLVPALGYQQVSTIVRTSLAENRAFLDVVEEKGLLKIEEAVLILEELVNTDDCIAMTSSLAGDISRLPSSTCLAPIQGRTSNVIRQAKAGSLPEMPQEEGEMLGRNVLVSEAYLRQLQAQSSYHIRCYPGDESHSRDASSQTSRETSLRPSTQGGHENSTPTLTLKHATSEAFVSGLKRLSYYPEGLDQVPNYEYVSLSSDKSCSEVLTSSLQALNVAIQLPPYPYALQLVQQFELYMGYEYHWYLRRDFHSALQATYRCPQSAQSRSHTWLCKLLAVLALEESFDVYGPPPLIDLNPDQGSICNSSSRVLRRGQGKSVDGPSSYLPGAGFFEQSLSLFRMPSEEPHIGQVEALNLISFFCYSLNRRKTAYMYAGTSMRIACTLMLHKPAISETPATTEHQKRVWWTTSLMEAMTSSERGLRSTFGFMQAEQHLPSDELLAPNERDNFWDAQLMAAHLKLCKIRSLILETLGHLHEYENDFDRYEKAVEVPLRELELWKRELPPDISFEFSQGVPQDMLDRPSVRSLASMYLRYHQGYILLIRPVFFKLLGTVLGKDTNTTPSSSSSLDGLSNLSSQCLAAAKCNMRILTTLSSKDLIAKYGFYDSLHLFSGIKIFVLSRLVSTVSASLSIPATAQSMTVSIGAGDDLTQDPEDISLCNAAKELLGVMASCGNRASKGHLQLLEEIERLLDVVSHSFSQEQPPRSQTPGSLFGTDLFPWIDSIDSSGYFLDLDGGVGYP